MTQEEPQQPPEHADQLDQGDHPDRGVQDRGPQDGAGEGVGVGDLDDLLPGEGVHDGLLPSVDLAGKTLALRPRLGCGVVGLGRAEDGGDAGEELRLALVVFEPLGRGCVRAERGEPG